MVSAPSSLVWIANWVFIRPTTFRALASSTTWRRSSAWVSADSEYGGSEHEESPECAGYFDVLHHATDQDVAVACRR